MANDLPGNLLIAQGAAPYANSAYQGGIWNTISAAGTPLVVIPTTLCIFELFNNTGVIGPPMYLEILRLSLFHLLGTAALHSQSIWAEVTTVKAAPSISATVIGSNSGRAPYTSTAGTRVIGAAGTTVVSGGWQPYGMPGSGTVATATPGEAFSVPVDGILTVPPGCSLALTCVDTLATASSVQVGCTWNEKPAGLVTNVN